jgi:hypothetical protein
VKSRNRDNEGEEKIVNSETAHKIHNKGQHETNKTPRYQDRNDHILIHESVKSNEIKNVKEARK